MTFFAKCALSSKQVKLRVIDYHSVAPTLQEAVVKILKEIARSNVWKGMHATSTSSASFLANDGRADSAPTLRSLLRSRIAKGDFLETRRKLFDAYWEFIYQTAVKTGLSKRQAERLVQDTLLDLAAECHAHPPDGPFRERVIELTAEHVIERLRSTDQARPPTKPIDLANLRSQWDIFIKKAAVKRVGRKIRAREWQAYSLHRDERKTLGQVARTLQGKPDLRFPAVLEGGPAGRKGNGKISIAGNPCNHMGDRRSASDTRTDHSHEKFGRDPEEPCPSPFQRKTK